MSDDSKKIEIDTNGPYLVSGGIPLVRKTQVVSEYGEPLAWKDEEPIPVGDEYRLCRCGQSQDKPFCDNTHLDKEFDGTESAPVDPSAARQVEYPGDQILVKKDPRVCMEAGFCANRLTRIEQLAAQTGDPEVRAQVIGMVERCPSGSLTYTQAPGEPDVELELPQQIAVITEITSEGPITGPLWVTGGIPIERCDGQPIETRNRVTLCGCGLSKIKPLCDGTHRAVEEEKLRQAKEK